MKIKNTDIFVVHGKHLIERKKFLKTHFIQQKIFHEKWCDKFNKEDLKEKLIEKYYDDSIEGWNKKISVYPGNIPYKKLNAACIAVTIEHINILNYIINSPKDYFIVFEDDIILEYNFINKIENVFKQEPSDWDVIFFGEGCNLRIPNADPNKYFYKKDHPATRCNDSYFITKNAAKILYKSMIPFSLPIDYEMSWHLKEHDMKVYWVEPPLVQQGTKTGKYKSATK